MNYTVVDKDTGLEFCFHTLRRAHDFAWERLTHWAILRGSYVIEASPCP